MDSDHDGMISHKELVKICKKNLVFFNESEFFNQIDINGDGMINYSEFLMVTLDFRKYLNKQMLQEIFNMMDIDESETITIDELKIFFNLDYKNPLLKELIEEVDINNDD